MAMASGIPDSFLAGAVTRAASCTCLQGDCMQACHIVVSMHVISLYTTQNMYWALVPLPPLRAVH